MENQTAILTKPKKPRGELRLPQLHFVAMDDWVDKLGEKSFVLWLKLLTHADRRDPERIQDIVPYDIESLAKKHLGMSKAKFYRLIKPLWNYGLVDLIEYEASTRKTQKPVNVIIYEYPQNDYGLAIKPLEKLRDYETDYKSSGTKFGKKGGRPKIEKDTTSNRFKNKTVGKYHLNRFKSKTVTVSKVKRLTVSKIKPNNVSNESSNVSNESNNVLNNSSSSIDRDNTIHRESPKKNIDDDENIKKLNLLFNENSSYQYLYDYLDNKKVNHRDIEDTIIKCSELEITSFTRADLDIQWQRVIEQLDKGSITVFSKFFAKGLAIIKKNKGIRKNHHEQVQRDQDEDVERKRARQQLRSTLYYNWLEES
ncbi:MULTISPECIES: hypothetical protein [Halobacillus]|uniref:hypothetical protein n=1 Tax=Halobacillus TaxID=45667 RepID=UPI0009A90703|nr:MULTISPECIES: hypothetical protein [Halobacillus]